MATVADKFFCPALMTVSDGLKLSPHVAGVTFLAMGNGSPDIFSSFAAVKQGVFDQAIGELLGGAMFVTTVVVASIVLFSAVPVQVSKVPFIRDVLFLMIAAIVVFIILFDHQIHIWEAILFICFYVIYVTVVSVSQAFTQRRSKEVCNERSFLVEKNVQVAHPPSYQGVLVVESEAQGDLAAPFSSETQEIMEEGEADVNANLDVYRCHLGWYHRQRCRFISHIGWEDMSKFDRVMYCLFFPVNLLQLCTIPNMEYCALTTTVYPVFISVIASLVFGHGSISFGHHHVPTYAVIISIGVLLSILVAAIIFSRSNRSFPKYKLVFTPVALVMSVLWIYVAANELVNILEASGIVLGVSNAIMGLTLLAWGNSVGDWIANTIVARNGYAQMAIAACYAAPFCNIMMGMGISIIYSIATTGHSYHIKQLPNTVFFAMCTLLLGLLATLVAVACNRFEYRRGAAVGLLALYVFCLFLGLLSETKVVLSSVLIF